MFKVGDRVRFKEAFKQYPKGYEAVVTLIDEKGDPEISGPLSLVDNFFSADLASLVDVLNRIPDQSTNLLDQFAMAALMGILAGMTNQKVETSGGSDADDLSRAAYNLARAMMRVRSEEKPDG